MLDSNSGTHTPRGSTTSRGSTPTRKRSEAFQDEGAEAPIAKRQPIAAESSDGYGMALLVPVALDVKELLADDETENYEHTVEASALSAPGGEKVKAADEEDCVAGSGSWEAAGQRTLVGQGESIPRTVASP